MRVRFCWDAISLLSFVLVWIILLFSAVWLVIEKCFSGYRLQVIELLPRPSPSRLSVIILGCIDGRDNQKLINRSLNYCFVVTAFAIFQTYPSILLRSLGLIISKLLKFCRTSHVVPTRSAIFPALSPRLWLPGISTWCNCLGVGRSRISRLQNW